MSDDLNMMPDLQSSLLCDDVRQERAVRQVDLRRQLDAVHLVATAPLFDAKRWRETVRLATGHYREALGREDYR